MKIMLLAVGIIATSIGLGFHLGRWSTQEQIQSLMSADADLKTADAHLKESCTAVHTINEQLLGQMSGDNERIESATAQLKKDVRVMSFCKEHLQKEMKGLPQ